ncbi:hypothetical protein KSP40_PGU010461 [Platanthera guangdongensis]|uniref:Uncharacterized protein n=1 Tax=Platanthera guangdongensis TaxID=2320717 RepID=A0ABR2N0K3_9ASPA
MQPLTNSSVDPDNTKSRIKKLRKKVETRNQSKNHLSVTRNRTQKLESISTSSSLRRLHSLSPASLQVSVSVGLSLRVSPLSFLLLTDTKNRGKVDSAYAPCTAFTPRTDPTKPCAPPRKQNAEMFYPRISFQGNYIDLGFFSILRPYPFVIFCKPGTKRRPKPSQNPKPESPCAFPPPLPFPTLSSSHDVSLQPPATTLLAASLSSLTTARSSHYLGAGIGGYLNRHGEAPPELLHEETFPILSGYSDCRFTFPSQFNCIISTAFNLCSCYSPNLVKFEF